MDRFLIRLEILAGMAGHLTVALVSLGIFGVLLWVQLREYRHEWRAARRSWWVIKLGVPLGGIAVVGLALAVMHDSEGLVGLALFYTGIGVWLILGPFIVGAIVAHTADVPRPRAIRAAASLAVLLVVAWFAGASAVNSFVAAFRPIGGLGARIEYEAFSRILESKPTPAGDAVELIEERIYALADDRRLLHLAWRVDPTLEFHGQRVRIGEPGGPSTWNSTLGHCHGSGEIHLTNVLEKGEWLEVRLAWHRGSPESAVGVEHRIESPLAGSAYLPWLSAALHGRVLEVSVPVPEHLLDWRWPGAGRFAWENHGRRFGAGAFSRRCLFPPIEVPEPAAAARITFYSEELHERVYREVFAPSSH